VADVSRWSDVERLAGEAVARFGRIDTWINNAAVSEYATVDQMQPEEFERIIQVNLLGHIYGSRAALLQFKRQGNGTIINVASALAERSVPLQSAYCASKHGVKGFTEALRLEVKREHKDIHACLVMPSSINTPLFSNARSRLGEHPMPVRPIYDPEVVAETLTTLAVRPRAEVVVGGAGKLLTVMQRISPGLVDWYMLQNERMFRQQRSGRPDNEADNLFTSTEGTGEVRGQFGEGSKPRSLYTRNIELHPLRKAMLIWAPVLAGLVLLRARAAR
jgi:NAD(P)-dependent dehydrogenase (short-subunit alcohol dehydrogenase family)